MKNFIHEIHRRSLWQVLGIYLAGSWVALQVVEQLAEAASLPPWVRPLSLVLLVIGFPIVMATAFVQEGPDPGSQAEDDPTAPTDEAPEGGGAVEEQGVPPVGGHGSSSHAGAGTGEGLLPRRLFTWRNAILGGVVAFSLLFGLAGLFVLLRSPASPFAPEMAIAVEADPAIAVLPFTVQGESVSELREGMVELLGTNLDGAGGLRTIDSRTVMARFREHVRDGDDPDFETARRIASAAGARYLLTGSAVAIGAGVRMSAQIHDVSSGENLGSVQVEGSSDAVFELVDRLSVETRGAILGDDASDLPRVDLARATTSSLPALRAYLEGSAHFRASRFDEAVRAYERAVEADSTFALAHYRLSDAFGWAESIMSDAGQGAIDRAARHADRLPEREATLVRGTRALLHGDHRVIPEFETFVRRYPDDVEGWYLLGDLYMHLGGPGLVEPGQAEEAFRKSIELDPDFSPAHIHYVDYAFYREPDSAEARARLAAYDLLAGGTERVRGLRLAADLAFGDPQTRRQAIAALDTTRVSLTALASTNLSHPRLLDAQTEVAAALDRRGDPWARAWFVYNRLMRGRPTEVVAGPRPGDPGGM
ncbi:MAG: hypothetical protein R3266_12950, partial [Gemmatimonadota bacterium]|nr:hypothetical protein [Gemmatimonadota bacterium]